MIRIDYRPQLALPGYSLRYSWRERILTAQILRDGALVAEEDYDLSVLQPGDEIERVEPENLPISPLLSARAADDGTLDVVLLYWYEGNEPQLSEEVRDG